MWVHWTSYHTRQKHSFSAGADALSTHPAPDTQDIRKMAVMEILNSQLLMKIKLIMPKKIPVKREISVRNMKLR